MKLAEALARRADLQKRIEALRARLKNNAKVQAGEEPAEDPKDLLIELESELTELTDLIARINATNLAVVLDNGQTMTRALAERDKLKLWRSVLIDLINASAIVQDLRTRSEVRFHRTVDVTEIRKQVDRLAHQHRELDTLIQMANWNHDIAD